LKKNVPKIAKFESDDFVIKVKESHISLLTLNKLIKDTLQGVFEQPCWIVAEISELNENKNGHCYLELVEKEEKGDKIIAKARATIWSYAYRMIKSYFESVTSKPLGRGIKVLLAVKPDFHELYGLSLNITDIDPTYTLGDMAKRRAEIIDRLEKEGIIDGNKSLDFPLVPQRIAIISSESAAGYGDFMDQLYNNAFGFRYETHLFQAVMQGEAAEASIISALDSIFNRESDFDVVVIIRGGGSKSDLSCFDSYDIALHITQFPIPVISGIGHQRDDSIVDFVAYQSLKTPTAVAEFLIQIVADYQTSILNLFEQITHVVEQKLKKDFNYIQHIEVGFAPTVLQFLKNHNDKLQNKILNVHSLSSDLCTSAHAKLTNFQFLLNKLSLQCIEKQIDKLDLVSKELPELCSRFFLKTNEKLNAYQKIIELQNPELLLKKGYSMTYSGSKLVKSVNDLSSGDNIITKFSNGQIESKVN